MKQNKLIDVKLVNSYTDVTGHVIGSLYYRISPRNWSKWNPMRILTLIWGYEPVWVIGYNDKDTPWNYDVAKLYEHRLSELKTLDDLMNLIDETECLIGKEKEHD